MAEDIAPINCKQRLPAFNEDDDSGSAGDATTAAAVLDVSVPTASACDGGDEPTQDTVHLPKTPIRLTTPLNRKTPPAHLTPPSTPLCHTPCALVPCTPKGQRAPPIHCVSPCPSKHDELLLQSPTIRTPILAADQESPVKHRHQRRKFLDNYFFLKNLNALPLTPERKRKERDAGPFCRRALQFVTPDASLHAGAMDAPPSALPPLSPSTPVARAPLSDVAETNEGEMSPPVKRFIRTYDAQPTDDIASESNDCVVSHGEPLERSHTRVTDASPVLNVGSSAGSSTHTQDGRSYSPLPVPADEGTVCGDIPHQVTRTLTPCRLRADEVHEVAGEDIPDDTSITTHEKVTQSLDCSGVAPMGVCDFSIHLASITSYQSGEMSVVSEGANGPRCPTVGVTTSSQVDGNSPDGRAKQAPFCRRTSRGKQRTRPHGVACVSTSATVETTFNSLFYSYQNQLLHLAFDVLYARIVAFPAIEMLEGNGRRLICMQRDAWMRELIELNALLLPMARGRSRSRRRNGDTSRAKSSRNCKSRRHPRSSTRPRTGQCYIVSGEDEDDILPRDCVVDGPVSRAFNRNITQSVVIMGDAANADRETEEQNMETIAQVFALPSHPKLAPEVGCLSFLPRFSSRRGKRKDKQISDVTVLPTE